jgi:hypothetical protein
MINKTLGVIGLGKRLEPPDSGKLPETKVEPDTLTDEAEASIGPTSPAPTRRPFCAAGDGRATLADPTTCPLRNCDRS